MLERWPKGQQLPRKPDQGSSACFICSHPQMEVSLIMLTPLAASMVERPGNSSFLEFDGNCITLWKETCLPSLNQVVLSSSWNAACCHRLTLTHVSSTAVYVKILVYLRAGSGASA